MSTRAVDFIDLQFQRTPQTIAAALLPGADGVTIVDPGPASCLPALEQGLRHRGMALADVRTLLLTHIHLDHAGASGSIVERVPSVRVFVHEIGAPHMVDPGKLLASVTRLYGDRMDTLWGPFLPVPADRVHALSGGERLADHMRVAYTPGHAKHHVSYLDERTGVAYVGDNLGVCVSRDYVLVPTPPPDIDIDAWDRTLDTIGAWNPDALFLTHFGPRGPAHERLAHMRLRLAETAAMGKRSFECGATDEERSRWFVEELRAEARRALPESDARALEIAAPFDQIWQGLARYWRKKGEVV
jgi:glyoxylase-like metal-dependent hydrolase (beta-lactamase superfamily II)